MQAKLLRALQEKSFFRPGSERATRSDLRVIAATDRDLHADMAAGTFREDLFYRLAVIRIDLPPLRERPQDIRWLTERMLQQIALEQGRPVAMSEAFLRDVMGRNWNGNARELRSHLEEAVVMSEAGILDGPATAAGIEPGAAVETTPARSSIDGKSTGLTLNRSSVSSTVPALHCATPSSAMRAPPRRTSSPHPGQSGFTDARADPNPPWPFNGSPATCTPPGWRWWSG